MPKLSLENSNDTILSMAGGGAGVHTFPKGISSKVNSKSATGVRLAYFEAIVQYGSQYATGTLP